MFGLFRRKKKLSIHHCAFAMMLGTAVSQQRDEGSVRVIRAVSPMSEDAVRAELFFLRCFALTAGVVHGVTDKRTQRSILDSFLTILHSLAPSGQSNLPVEGLSSDKTIFYNALMVHHEMLLEEYRRAEPAQYKIVMSEGASRFGTRELTARNDGYAHAFVEGDVAAVGRQFSEYAGANTDHTVQQLGQDEMRRYLAFCRAILDGVTLTQHD
jgi:hypothetical protein